MLYDHGKATVYINRRAMKINLGSLKLPDSMNKSSPVSSSEILSDIREITVQSSYKENIEYRCEISYIIKH